MDVGDEVGVASVHEEALMPGAEIREAIFGPQQEVLPHLPFDAGSNRIAGQNRALGLKVVEVDTSRADGRIADHGRVGRLPGDTTGRVEQHVRRHQKAAAKAQAGVPLVCDGSGVPSRRDRRGSAGVTSQRAAAHEADNRVGLLVVRPVALEAVDPILILRVGAAIAADPQTGGLEVVVVGRVNLKRVCSTAAIEWNTSPRLDARRIPVVRLPFVTDCDADVPAVPGGNVNRRRRLERHVRREHGTGESQSKQHHGSLHESAHINPPASPC